MRSFPEVPILTGMNEQHMISRYITSSQHYLDAKPQPADIKGQDDKYAQVQVTWFAEVGFSFWKSQTLVFLMCIRHRNRPTGPAHPHRFLCETENDPAAAAAQLQHRYSHDMITSRWNSRREPQGALILFNASNLFSSLGFLTNKTGFCFVCVSPAEEKESLCGTLGVAIHSACDLQQPACAF